MRYVIVITVLGLVLGFGGHAWGVTHQVPADFETIQTAINAATNGDTIVVAPGTYAENLSFQGQDITLTSQDPNDPNTVAATILTAIATRNTGRSRTGGSIRTSVVLFNQGETRACILTGFTIQGGFGTLNEGMNGEGSQTYVGGGVFCGGASPTLSHNIFTNNGGPINPGTGEETWGGGVGAMGSNALIHNNTFVENQAVVGGAMVILGGQPLIANNLFIDNTAWAIGGLYLVGGQLYNNTLVGNSAEWAIGHLFMTPADFPVGLRVQNNIFTASPAGGGVLIGDIEAGPIFAYNLVAGNQPTNFIDPMVLEGGTLGPDFRSWLTENGNLPEDPRFNDVAVGDFSLQGDSPCINAGNPEYNLTELTTDLWGQARVFAKRVDIGAYEFHGLLSPLADAGADQEAHVNQQVTLDGSGSLFPDPNAPIQLYLWDQLSGPAVTLSDPLSPSPRFTPKETGKYRFELVIYDGQQASRPDEVLITVIPAPAGGGRGR